LNRSLPSQILLWTAVGLVLALLFRISDQFLGFRTGWTLALLGPLCAYLWALLLPLIRGIGRRLDLTRPFPWPALLLHLVAALAFAMAHVLVFSAVYMLIQRLGSGHLSYAKALGQIGYYFFLVNVVYYAFVVAWEQARMHYARSQERELRSSQLEREVLAMRLHHLRSQLQPHFLFNTLNGIAGLLRSGDSEAGLEMLLDLSVLLRCVLDTGNDLFCEVRDEIRFVERYLRIERRRFGSRLRVEVDVDPGSLDGRIPALLLQPLVENAIRHGIEVEPEAGRVKIELTRDGDRLVMHIRNTGPKLDPDWHASGGVGLANTRARLEHLFPERHRFVLSNHGSGVQALIEIPFETGDEDGSWDA